MKPITVLWYGAGQDSTAILFKCVYDESFRAKYVTGDLVVICSDTGNEYPETYRYINNVARPFCVAHGIDFKHIKPWQGFHPKTWSSLQAQFKRSSGVMSVAFPKSCTDNLKVKPCYNYLESYINERYGFENRRQKSAFYDYAKAFGKLNVIIGFGADEGRRVAKNTGQLRLELDNKPIRQVVPVFVQKTINKIYPLIEEGMTRADCQSAIAGYGHEVPPPSNCMMCPFADHREILLLARKYPDQFTEWRVFEHQKLRRDKERGQYRNLGVKGKGTLAQYLSDAEAKYGHMTLEELEAHRFSHGHCVKSKY